jgi:hypothetical protein
MPDFWKQTSIGYPRCLAFSRKSEMPESIGSGASAGIRILRAGRRHTDACQRLNLARPRITHTCRRYWILEGQKSTSV